MCVPLTSCTLYYIWLWAYVVCGELFHSDLEQPGGLTSPNCVQYTYMICLTQNVHYPRVGLLENIWIYKAMRWQIDLNAQVRSLRCAHRPKKNKHLMRRRRHLFDQSTDKRADCTLVCTNPNRTKRWSLLCTSIEIVVDRGGFGFFFTRKPIKPRSLQTYASCISTINASFNCANQVGKCHKCTVCIDSKVIV